MKTQLIAALLVALFALASLQSKPAQSQEEFLSWKQRFRPEWTQAQTFYRRSIFHRKLQVFREHNSNKSATYKMGINQFTPFTDEEFQSLYLNVKPYKQWQHVDLELKRATNSIDWTDKGMVSPVKDQGRCGSCWAFSAVGTLESLSLMSGKSQTFSEQQLVDCTRTSKYGNKGCNGGFNYQGLNYVRDSGITTDASYPYQAKNSKCKMEGGLFKILLVRKAHGCTGIYTALYSRPIGVSVDAAKWSAYESGIFNNCKARLDHDVLLVGYNGAAWKIKNSWGTSWGQEGFIRLESGNTCGICLDDSPWPE